MKRFLFSVSAVIVLVSMGGLTSCNNSSSTTLPGSWDKMGDFAGIPRDGAVSFVINNQAYVGTGYNYFSNTFQTDFWRYDPSSDSWYPAKAFPGAARSSAVAFTINGKGYVGGGYNIVNGTTNPLSDFYSYDPTADSWSPIASFGYPTYNADSSVANRYGCAAFTVRAGNTDRAFVGWGEDVNQFDYKDLWEYDPINNVWIQRPDTGSKRVYPFVFVIDNLAYIGGGFDPAGGNSYPVDLNKFDITKLNDDGSGSPWSQMNGLTGKDQKGNAIAQPRPREQASTFVISGFGYLTMGTAGAGDCWQYAPTTDTWLQYFSMTTNTPITGAARSSAVSFAVTVGNAGYGIVTTGGSGNTKFDDCWRFNPIGVEPDYK